MNAYIGITGRRKEQQGMRVRSCAFSLARMAMPGTEVAFCKVERSLVAVLRPARSTPPVSPHGRTLQWNVC